MALTFTPLEYQVHGEKRDLVSCEGTTMPSGFQDIAEDILNMEVREDDVWVCSFPKSGTTWTQELVWCIANDLDYEKATITQMVRFPFLEFEQKWRRKSTKHVNKSELEVDYRVFTKSVEYVKSMESPRFIKTHLPFHLLPLQLQRGDVKAKMVYVMRNPMDTCISYYHHHQLVRGFTGTLEDFAALFINGKVVNAPFWSHHKGYLEKNKVFNILFLKFEEMKKDLPAVIRKTSRFFNKELTNDQVDKLCCHLSFANMKANPATNLENVVRTIRLLDGTASGEGEGEGRFLREGAVDQWKERFREEWVQRFREWTQENLLGVEEDSPLYSYRSFLK